MLKLSTLRLTLLAMGRKGARKARHQPRHAVDKPFERNPIHQEQWPSKVVEHVEFNDNELSDTQLVGLNALLALSYPAQISTAPSARPQRRILTILQDRALTGALALMISSVMAGVLGYVFWALTARHHDASALGTVSAEVSSISFLAVVASLNLSSIFARFLPVAGWNARRLIVTSYLGTGLAGMSVAVIFLATPLAKGLILGGELGAFSFVICVVLNSVFNIQDGGLIGFGRFELVPVENIVVALLRLALLPLVAASFSIPIGILWSWALPMGSAVLVVNVLILGPLSRWELNQNSCLPSARTLGRQVAVGSTSTAIYSASSTFMPALVTRQFGTTHGGYFYVPWIIATMIVVLLTNITTSMLREVVASPDNSSATIRRSIRLIFLIVSLVTGSCVLASHLILMPLGSSFVVNGSSLLRWIGLAAPAAAINSLFGAVCLIRQHPWPAFTVNLTTSAVMLGGVILLGGHSQIGHVGMIYCAAQWGAAVLIAVPTVRALKEVRRT